MQIAVLRGTLSVEIKYNVARIYHQNIWGFELGTYNQYFGENYLI